MAKTAKRNSRLPSAIFITPVCRHGPIMIIIVSLLSHSTSQA